MDYNNEKNNRVYLDGEIVSPAVYSHEVYGEGFYEFTVSVNRLSGQADVLPVTISERLVLEGGLGVGKRLTAVGQFRSYNKIVDGKSKLMLTVFVRELLSEPELRGAFRLRVQAARVQDHPVQQRDSRPVNCRKPRV